VDVKNVSGECFAARRPLEQERKLSVCIGMLCEIIVDDERILPAASEVLGNSRASVGPEVLQARRASGIGGNDHGVRKDAAFEKSLSDSEHTCDRLTDDDIHANYIISFLRCDEVERESRLSYVPIADNELPLPTPNRNGRINRHHSR
jgi:hypothetical protein